MIAGLFHRYQYFLERCANSANGSLSHVLNFRVPRILRVGLLNLRPSSHTRHVFKR